MGGQRKFKPNRKDVQTYINTIRLPGERWKVYPYSVVKSTFVVSNLGRVLNLYFKTPRLMIPSNKECYYTVYIKRKGFKNKRTTLHTIVLETFVGKAPQGMECRHLDGIKAHNYLSNLEWSTHKINMRDLYIHGTVSAYGEKAYASKLSSKQARAIFLDTRAKKFIAADYNISKTTVKEIWHRRSYTEETKDLKSLKGIILVEYASPLS